MDLTFPLNLNRVSFDMDPQIQALFRKKFKLFSSLHEASLSDIVSLFTKFTLKRGESLFKQGDRAEYLFLLLEGQLEAVLKTASGVEKIVGTISSGETVGELGALSNEPRSLTIRAAIAVH